MSSSGLITRLVIQLEFEGTAGPSFETTTTMPTPSHHFSKFYTTGQHRGLGVSAAWPLPSPFYFVIVALMSPCEGLVLDEP